MRKVYESQDIIAINHLKTVLVERGFHCFVKNENLIGSAAGELTPIVCWPELWVDVEDRWPEVLELIEEFKTIG